MAKKKNDKSAKSKSAKSKSAKSKTAKSKTAKSKQSGKSAVAISDRLDLTHPLSWFGDWLDDWPRVLDRRLVEPLWRAASADPIKVEQFTDDDDIVIRAEIPGVDPDEDIEVSVTDNRLTISAHREQREESKDDDGFRSEFRYGSFQRILTLPPGSDADDVSAIYDDGILEVRVTPDTSAAESAKVSIGKKVGKKD